MHLHADPPRPSAAPFFTGDELRIIREAVALAESRTSGEIRVKIIPDLDSDIATPREQAIREFYREGMDRTREGTGVLILLILRNRAVEVLGDKGINEKLPRGSWHDIVLGICMGLSNPSLRCQAICLAVKRVGDLLAEHFPRRADDADELPNEVIIAPPPEEAR